MKARLGLGGDGRTPLALVTTHMDRQRLESGNELLTVTGRVINPTGKEQTVPPLQAQLKTAAGKVVYSWTIAPPAPSLAPGASASFNSAEVNVPPGGEELTITLGSAARLTSFEFDQARGLLPAAFAVTMPSASAARRRWSASRSSTRTPEMMRTRRARLRDDGRAACSLAPGPQFAAARGGGKPKHDMDVTRRRSEW